MKRLIFACVVLSCLFTTSCENESYYCSVCKRYHYYYQYYTDCCGNGYHSGYCDGYADGYGVNADYKRLQNNLRYTQWYAYGQNDNYYNTTNYIYDFDLIRPGYLTVALCQINEYLRPVKCIEYKQYPYEFVTLINNKTLLIYVYVTDTDFVEYRVEFVSSTATKQMYLHFNDGSIHNKYDCRKLSNPSSEIDFLDILY